ncbi:N-acetylmuramoyl-L-alanine amidase [Candidatus Babeliales bacterium]|nr:N-acetylmuramoyl-L-alanine amidase [Candidatus Babeliales bacterium]
MKKFNKLFIFFTFLTFHSTQPLAIKQQPSPFYDHRKNYSGKKLQPKFIIMHFTANCSEQESWRSFFNFLRPVSAHYLIDVDGKVTQMVSEEKRAWHAGESSWKDQFDMNSVSIGIEIINPGFSNPDTDPCTSNKKLWNKNTGQHVSGSDKLWYAFTNQQIDSLIKLCKSIMHRYQIPSSNVLGHSDIAPGRKVDPGPLFPWQKLSEQGIGIWWKNIQPCSNFTTEELQKKLQKLGYNIKITGNEDEQTTKVIASFQMHFQQNNISGLANNETMQILNNLLTQSVQGFDK